MEGIVDHIKEVDLHGLAVEERELNNRLLLEAARIGKFTPSEFHRLMAYEHRIDELPKGAETYVMEKVAETLTESCDFANGFQTEDMRHGSETEPIAIEWFEEVTSIKVANKNDEQQFYEYQGENELLRGHIGGTPDGEIDSDIGVEVKCPKSKTHLDYFLNLTEENLKEKKKEYYWQIQGYMMLLNKKAWFFVSFDDRFVEKEKKILVLKISRNETDIQRLLARLELAVLKKNEILKTIQ